MPTLLTLALGLLVAGAGSPGGAVSAALARLSAPTTVSLADLIAANSRLRAAADAGVHIPTLGDGKEYPVDTVLLFVERDGVTIGDRRLTDLAGLPKDYLWPSLAKALRAAPLGDRPIVALHHDVPYRTVARVLHVLTLEGGTRPELLVVGAPPKPSGDESAKPTPR